MRHLFPLTLLLAILPSLAEAETWTIPRRAPRGPALLAGPVLSYTEFIRAEQAHRGLSGLLELGASFPVGYEEDELYVAARAGGGAPGFSLSAQGGFRGVFEGQDEWKTYMDLGAVVHVQPAIWAGPRVGMGVRRILSDALSLYGGLGVGLGFGSGLRLDVELCTGVRWGL